MVQMHEAKARRKLFAKGGSSGSPYRGVGFSRGRDTLPAIFRHLSRELPPSGPLSVRFKGPPCLLASLPHQHSQVKHGTELDRQLRALPCCETLHMSSFASVDASGSKNGGESGHAPTSHRPALQRFLCDAEAQMISNAQKVVHGILALLRPLSSPNFAAILLPVTVTTPRPPVTRAICQPAFRVACSAQTPLLSPEQS